MWKSKNLPKGYLSYSQMTLWQQNKDLYRQRYYGESKFIDTPEIRFGKEIAKHLEENKINGVKRFRKPEHEIKVDLEGYTLLGYIDSFCPRWKKIIEYKTSRTDVKDKWSQVKVQKHKQLDFYSLLVQMKYGSVHNECELIVLETIDEPIYQGKRQLELKDKNIKLTGRVTTYKRVIEQWERDFMRQEILKVIKEIENDYRHYKKIL